MLAQRLEFKRISICVAEKITWDRMCLLRRERHRTLLASFRYVQHGSSLKKDRSSAMWEHTVTARNAALTPYLNKVTVSPSGGYYEVRMSSGVQFGSVELLAKFDAESGILFWSRGQFGLYVDKTLKGFVSTEAGEYRFEVDVPGLESERQSQNHYFAMTYDNSTHQFATYIDGVLHESAVIPPMNVTRDAVDLLIGRVPVDFVVPKQEWSLHMFRMSPAVRPAAEIGGFSDAICAFHEDLSCPIHPDYTTLLLVRFSDYMEGDTLAPGGHVTDHSAKSESFVIFSYSHWLLMYGPYVWSYYIPR